MQTSTEIAAAIRAAIRDLGVPARAVGVRVDKYSLGATVYVTLPPNRAGGGQINVTVGGRLETLAALNAFFFNMVNGRGWICVALVVFASWRPGKALLGAALFAFFDALQLRLQQAVEGLSVVAISYYGVGLAGYALKALKGAGLALPVDLLSGLSLPLIAGAVWLGTRRLHHQL